MDPAWRTLDLLEHTEHTMHQQVRHEHAGNALPVLAVKYLSASELQVDCVSARRTRGLAVGIIRGLTTYYDEADRIAVTLITSTEG